MISSKNMTLFALFFLTLVAIMGCSPTTAPEPMTPTPPPGFGQEGTTQEYAPIGEKLPINQAAVVDSLSLSIGDQLPVEVRITAGGVLDDDCTKIDGWEQSISGNVLFVRPITTQLPGSECSNSELKYKEGVLLDVHGLSADELSKGGYILDVNGMIFPLSLAVASSLSEG